MVPTHRRSAPSAYGRVLISTAFGLLLAGMLGGCSEGRSSLTCADGKDNDADGAVDCDDPDCAQFCDDENEGDCSIGDCDGDGYTVDDGDCDDEDDDIHPDAEEECDGVDQDCDGEVDEDFDGDGDGYPDGDEDECADNLPADQLDCDDLDLYVNPGTEEVCGDGKDNDCDGDVDENVDEDGDGVSTCDGDCDDGDEDVYPGADEECNGIDDDCDGEIDDGLEFLDYYPDSDGDGYGDENGTPVNDCEPPPDHADNDDDCDDDDSSVHPGAGEECNDQDDDCDGQADEGLYEYTYYPDDDGDGYGATAGSVEDCAPPPGYVPDDGDCDDGDASVKPDAAEVCDDGIDNNCNGSVDGLADGCWVGGPIPLSAADAKLVGEPFVGQAGMSLASAGDVDGDGLDDLLIGAYAGNHLYTGGAYLVLGPTYGTVDLATADAVMLGDVDGDCAGASVAGGGDVNGDGYDDVLIGAPEWGGDDHGFAYLLLGPLSGTMQLGAAADAIFQGADGIEAGYSVALADLDTDGHADLIVGAEAAFDGDGAVVVIDGPASGTYTLATVDALYSGEDHNDRLGSSVSALGDVDDDGTPDLLMGARIGGPDSRGKTFLDYGPVSGTQSVAAASASFLGEAAYDYSGESVAIVRDVDGDGRDDLLIGADWADPAGSNSGAAYLIYGPVSGSNYLSNADVRFTGEASDHRAGASVSSAGDVNGDGLGDLLVGASGFDDLGDNQGAAYLVYGPVVGDMDLSLADARLEGENDGDFAGYTVASAGDLNGDGYDDLAVGAPWYQEISTKGAVYVVYGGP